MRNLGLILTMTLLCVGSVARAQLDCSGGNCETTKYGFGTNTDFRNSDDPVDPLKFGHDDFGTPFDGISYYYNRGDLTPGGFECDVERIFNPLPGQVHLREFNDCTPTSVGPQCEAGVNAGKSCHLGANEPFASRECPDSSCQATPGISCRVEIPISDGGKTAPADASEYWITTLNGGPGAPFVVSALTGNTLGGTSAERECLGGSNTRGACTTDADCPGGGTCEGCFPPFIRRKPSMGTRYLLPEDRRTALGLAAGATYIRWDKGLPDPAPGTPPENDPRIDNSTAFRLHQDDAAVCCNSTIPGLCTSSALPFSFYPVLWRPNCTAQFVVKSLINEDNILPDWIFQGGRISNFTTDPNYVLPGETFGVCLNNRDVPCSAPGRINTAQCTGPGAPFFCCTGAGTGANCGNECGPLGDTCDFRERGIRIQVSVGVVRDANSDPRPEVCGSALAVIRGKPFQGCMQEPRYPVDGDPGRGCLVFNYGIDARLDSNCDGTVDVPNDKCPFLSEWNQAADTDQDCPLDGTVDADCRGNECECGDSTLDGRVNVQDLVATNTMIFGVIPGQTIADANSDLAYNVSDIVAQNREIFSPDTSTCRHITSIRCGNNVRNEGEACDNGARCVGGGLNGQPCDASATDICAPTGGTCERLGGDGCNPACRIEAGWTCTGAVGSPSVCTQNP